MHKSLWLSFMFAAFTGLSSPLMAEPLIPTTATQAVVTQVNLNTADAAQLQQALNGVGAVKAQAIVEYREANGPFTSVDELLEVKGIGAATLEKNRERLTLN